MPNYSVKAVVIASLTIVVGACSSAPPLPPPPVLSFAGTAGCTESLSAASAVTVTVKKRKSSGEVVSTVDAAAACQSVDGVNRPYTVFKLPSSLKVQSIQAGGVFQRDRIFAAEVITMDADMATVRTFGPEAFRHRGGSLSVFFQARETEKYVAVRANPALIGSGYYFTQIEPFPEGTADPASSDISPLGIRREYSFEGLAFARVLLSEPSEVSPKLQ